MYKKIIGVFLVLVLMVSLTGCGRHGGSGNPAAPKDPSILLSTKIEKPTSAAVASIRGAIGASTAALTEAEVEIFLASGKTAILKEELETPGLYHLEASDEIPAMSYPFAINAKKGAVLIQAVITKQTEVADGLITCDHISTAVAQAAQLNANNATVTDFATLLADNTSLAYIDNLKETIKSEVKPLPKVIDNIIADVQNAIFSASETGSAPAPANLNTYKDDLEALENLETQEPQEPQEPQTPQTPDTRETIIALAESFVSLFQKAHNKKAGYNAEITEEEKAILSKDFILSGYNREDFLNSFQAGIKYIYYLVINEINGITLNNIEITELSEDLYLVHLDGTMDFINQNGENITYPFNSMEQGYECNQTTFDTFTNFELPTLLSEFTYFPIMVRKEGISWKVIGNQIKIDRPYMQMNRYLLVRNSEINESIEKIQYSFNTISFKHSTNLLKIIADNKEETGHNFGIREVSMSQAPKAGDSYKLTVNFVDDFPSQTFTHKSLYVYPIHKDMLTVNFSAPNKLAITWPQAEAGEFQYYSSSVHVYDVKGHEDIGHESAGRIMVAAQNSVTLEFNLDQGKSVKDIGYFKINVNIQTKAGDNTIWLTKDFINE